ncbi:hypothetical protein [Acinetobacter sp. ANC 4648]|uniref:hypothetical protein n=1 Tax=Acinetobacter sp. ANC 4648 TaxID=1977875 RepID=UPI000A34AE06|nr:hypothetical protein [Acinetobacter sp. ANC 4648]OTG81180.1 hypothetical protein B9T27_12085 [Acinetobacter sp. ANC 4648]
MSEAAGGSTNAAFAGLNSKAAVLEGVELSGDGAHLNNAKYIFVDTIVSRLYLATQLIIDLSTQKNNLKLTSLPASIEGILCVVLEGFAETWANFI